MSRSHSIQPFYLSDRHIKKQHFRIIYSSILNGEVEITILICYGRMKCDPHNLNQEWVGSAIYFGDQRRMWIGKTEEMKIRHIK